LFEVLLFGLIIKNRKYLIRLFYKTNDSSFNIYEE